MTQDLNASDKARVEWCIAVVREIADLGRDKPLGDLFPDAVMVLGCLRRIIEPSLPDTPTQG